MVPAPVCNWYYKVCAGLLPYTVVHANKLTVKITVKNCIPLDYLELSLQLDAIKFFKALPLCFIDYFINLEKFCEYTDLTPIACLFGTIHKQSTK